jgi:hypothetical protein
MMLCPKLDACVKAKACRTRCRYYYGRGVVRFVDDFDPDTKRVPGEPQEHTVNTWHICNYPMDINASAKFVHEQLAFLEE